MVYDGTNIDFLLTLGLGNIVISGRLLQSTGEILNFYQLDIPSINSKILKSLSVSGDDNWIPNIDLNTFSGNGIFFLSNGIENSPIESKVIWSPMLQVEKDNRDTIRQVIFSPSKIYMRAYQSNEWLEWKEI